MADGKRAPKAPGQAKAIAKRPAKQDVGRKPGTWLPGQSGNPAGRKPSGQALTDLLRGELALPVEWEGKPITKSQAIAKVLVAKALGLPVEGDLQAIKTIYERIDGKPAETVNLDGQLQYTEAEEQESILVPILKEQPEIWALVKQRLRMIRLEGPKGGNGGGASR